MNPAVTTADNLTETLIRVFADRLGRKAEELGPETNFFEAGGDSLMTVDISDKISSTFNIEFSLIEIFENPTPGALAERISSDYLAQTPLAEQEAG